MGPDAKIVQRCRQLKATAIIRGQVKHHPVQAAGGAIVLKGPFSPAWQQVHACDQPSKGLEWKRISDQSSAPVAMTEPEAERRNRIAVPLPLKFLYVKLTGGVPGLSRRFWLTLAQRVVPAPTKFRPDVL